MVYGTQYIIWWTLHTYGMWDTKYGTVDTVSDIGTLYRQCETVILLCRMLFLVCWTLCIVYWGLCMVCGTSYMIF